MQAIVFIRNANCTRAVSVFRFVLESCEHRVGKIVTLLRVSSSAGSSTGYGRFSRKLYWLWKVQQKALLVMEGSAESSTGYGRLSRKLYRLWKVQQLKILMYTSTPPIYQTLLSVFLRGYGNETRVPDPRILGRGHRIFQEISHGVPNILG